MLVSRRSLCVYRFKGKEASVVRRRCYREMNDSRFEDAKWVTGKFVERYSFVEAAVCGFFVKCGEGFS